MYDWCFGSANVSEMIDFENSFPCYVRPEPQIYLQGNHEALRYFAKNANLSVASSIYKKNQ